MAYVIPSDTHVVGDLGHTSDHDNIHDVLGLLAAVLAQGAGPSAARTTPPAGNATAVSALQTIQSWAGQGIGSGYFPWQFPVEAYGALGNGRIITDATMVSGSPNLTSPAQAQFVNATVAAGGDIGKSVFCSAAGTGTYAGLGSTAAAPCYIVSVSSATVAVLSVNAGNTTPGASLAAIGSDDSAALLACLAAAVAYAEAHQHGYVEIVGSNAQYGLGAGQSFTATNGSPCVFTVPTFAYPNGTKVYLTGASLPTGFSAATAYYVVSSSTLTFQLSATSGGAAINSSSTGSGLVQYSPVNFGGYLGNSLLPLPVNAPAAQKIIPVFTGPTKTQDQALEHWNQLVPQAALSQLVCMRTDGTNDGTYGPASVVGSPIDGYGGDLGLFTNMMPVVDGMQILVPFNSTYGGWDFFGCAEMSVPNGSCMPLAVVNVTAPTGAPYPNMYTSAPNNISNQWTAGLRLPCTGNNDRCDVVAWSCEGLCYGIMPSEHAYVGMARTIYCITGAEAYSGNGVSMPHAARIAYISCEGSSSGLGAFDGQINIDVDTIDCETATPIIYDPSNRLIGNIGVRNMGGTPGLTSVASMVNSGVQLKIICLDNAALMGLQASGAPAAPASTVAQANTYWRDALVFLQSTAAITAVKLQSPGASAVMTTVTGMTTGAGAAVPLILPVGPGRQWSATSAGGTLTTQWYIS